MAIANPNLVRVLVTLERSQVQQLDSLRWDLRARDRSALVRQAIDDFLSQNSPDGATTDETKDEKAA